MVSATESGFKGLVSLASDTSASNCEPAQLRPPTAMASSPPRDSKLPPSQPPTPFPLSTICLFPSPSSLSRWHRSVSTPATPPDDPPALSSPSPLPPGPQILGSARASAESSFAGSPRKRSFYSAISASEEILDDDALDECIRHSEKRSRRLTTMQVKALERAFELDNRLEPERKERLAKQVGLQARQVAVWFQNRRARWKTKQMERDYHSLKKKLESLKADRDQLLEEKEKLEAEVIRLKNDVKNRERLKLEAATEAGRIFHSEISSCVTAREYFEHAEQTSPHDQKDKDAFSTTYDSDGSAIDNVETPTRTQNSVALSVPSNVIGPGDLALTQGETYAFLDLPDLEHGKVSCGAQRATGDMFCAEGESYSGFVFDWW